MHFQTSWAIADQMLKVVWKTGIQAAHICRPSSSRLSNMRGTSRTLVALFFAIFEPAGCVTLLALDLSTLMLEPCFL